MTFIWIFLTIYFVLLWKKTYVDKLQVNAYIVLVNAWPKYISPLPSKVNTANVNKPNLVLKKTVDPQGGIIFLTWIRIVSVNEINVVAHSSYNIVSSFVFRWYFRFYFHARYGEIIILTRDSNLLYFGFSSHYNSFVHTLG